MGGGDKVVCLKTCTLLTCLLGKNDFVEFFIWGREFFWGGVFGGTYRGFSGGGESFKREKSRV